MNLRCLKLYRAYSISFNYSNVGKVFWSWILKNCIKVQEKKVESCGLLFPSSTKRELWPFHVNVVFVQRRQRNVQKSVMNVQSCCFACLDLLLFCRSSSPSSLRKLPSIFSFSYRISIWAFSLSLSLNQTCSVLCLRSGITSDWFSESNFTHGTTNKSETLPRSV